LEAKRQLLIFHHRSGEMNPFRHRMKDGRSSVDERFDAA
jgi:hypothetical protein